MIHAELAPDGSDLCEFIPRLKRRDIPNPNPDPSLDGEGDGSLEDPDPITLATRLFRSGLVMGHCYPSLVITTLTIVIRMVMTTSTLMVSLWVSLHLALTLMNPLRTGQSSLPLGVRRLGLAHMHELARSV